MRAEANAALKLLSLSIAFGLFTGCGEQPPRASVAAAQRDSKSEIDEVDALIAATKQHPSLVNPAENAGAPIHVDPVPKSGGAGAGHHHSAH